MDTLNVKVGHMEGVQVSKSTEQEEPIFLHISAAAEILGMSIRQVRNLCERGTLAHDVVARKTYVLAASLREYIASITVPKQAS